MFLTFTFMFEENDQLYNSHEGGGQVPGEHPDSGPADGKPDSQRNGHPGSRVGAVLNYMGDSHLRRSEAFVPMFTLMIKLSGNTSVSTEKSTTTFCPE